MPDEWTPQNVLRLIVVVTGCLALLILVVTVMLGLSFDWIDPDQVGTMKEAGVGSGLLGIIVVIATLLRSTIKTGASRGA